MLHLMGEAYMSGDDASESRYIYIYIRDSDGSSWFFTHQNGVRPSLKFFFLSREKHTTRGSTQKNATCYSLIHQMYFTAQGVEEDLGPQDSFLHRDTEGQLRSPEKQDAELSYISLDDANSKDEIVNTR
eukprot:gene6793-4874_t